MPSKFTDSTYILSIPEQPRQSTPFLWASFSPQYPDFEHQKLQLPVLSTACCPDLHLHEEGHVEATEKYRKTRIFLTNRIIILF